MRAKGHEKTRTLLGRPLQGLRRQIESQRRGLGALVVHTQDDAPRGQRPCQPGVSRLHVIASQQHRPDLEGVCVARGPDPCCRAAVAGIVQPPAVQGIMLTDGTVFSEPRCNRPKVVQNECFWQRLRVILCKVLPY